jgi:methyl-accepting chemotaxis protein
MIGDEVSKIVVDAEADTNKNLTAIIESIVDETVGENVVEELTLEIKKISEASVPGLISEASGLVSEAVTAVTEASGLVSEAVTAVTEASSVSEAVTAVSEAVNDAVTAVNEVSAAVANVVQVSKTSWFCKGSDSDKKSLFQGLKNYLTFPFSLFSKKVKSPFELPQAEKVLETVAAVENKTGLDLRQFEDKAKTQA